MLSVANYVMKGPTQAFIATLVLSALTVLIAPVGILVGAIIALVTLRVGEWDGLKVLALASATVLLIAMFSSGSLNPGLVAVVEYILPIWLLSWVLRNTNSLAMSLSLSMLIAGAGLIVFHLIVGDTTAWWQMVFQTYLQPMFTQSDVDYPQELFGNMADVATMLLAMFAVVLWFSILLIGRWWQSELYFEGKFREDFYALALPKNIAILAVVIALAGLFTGSDLVKNLSGVIMAGLMFQGIAIAHHAVHQREMSTMWLGGLYVLLFLFPQTILILATIGLIDTWVDIRSRWSKT